MLLYLREYFILRTIYSSTFRYDEEEEQVNEYQRIFLEDIEKLEIGNGYIFYDWLSFVNCIPSDSELLMLIVL